MQRLQMRFVALFLLFVVHIALSNIAMAQVSASISGRVEDPSGAAIPMATLAVTNLETGTARTVTSDNAGNYQVLSLAVGRYEVKAEKTGFKGVVQTGINLVVGQQAIVNLKLEVGSVQEQVTVTGDAPLVNTTTASVAGLVGERQVKELPLNGRSFDLLITLNAGAINFTSMKNPSGLVGGNFFSVAGRRPMENLTLLNGIEYTGAGNIAETPVGASGQLLGIDAVREYNVVSDTYGAEFGKRSGAQVNVVTQSGTNQLHGTLFEFLRNSKLDARNFFDHGSIPAFKRNQFGGAAGGPIRKDSVFVFGNYEGFRQRLGISDLTFVPDSNARKGILPCGSGGPTCAPGTLVGTPTQVANVDSRMLPFLNTLWPEANGPNLGGGIADAFSNPAQAIREDFGTLRFDETLSTKDSLSEVYTISDGYNVTPGLNPFFGTAIQLRNQIASVQETHIISPRLINTFTAGYSRTTSLNLTPPLIDLPAGLSFLSGNPSPGQLTIGAVGGGQSAGITATGAQTPFALWVRNLFTYSEGVQFVKGKHQISAGAWFQRIRENDTFPLLGLGQATFSSLQSMIQGTVSTFQIAPKILENGWRSWEGAWYVQDSIQLRPNLTLRVGLRHEFSNGWSEVNGHAESVLFDSSGVIQTLPRISGQFTTENNSKLLFSPRIGLAWDPFGKGKTSIRAAFGTYYNLVDWLTYLANVTPPLAGSASFSNVSLFSVIPIDPRAPVPPPCGTGIPGPCNIYSPRSIQSSFKVPTVESWNFSVEQQLNKDTALRVAYVGSVGYHQYVIMDPNSIPSQICSNPAGCVSGGIGSAKGAVPQGTEYIPVATGRPDPNLTFGIFMFTRGNSSYNGLQTELTRRLAQGLQFRANYTWSKNLDIMSSVAQSIAQNGAGVVLNQNNIRQDWGPSNPNVPHRSSINFSYELPFGQGKPWLNGARGVAEKLAGGWQLNSIMTLVSGFPLTPQIGSNRSGNGDLNNPDRPSYNTAFNGPAITPSPTRWIDPNIFTLPTPGTFGNVGKGTFTGPGLSDIDLSLFKNTHITERVGLQFRSEFFNIANRSNFGPPNLIMFSGTSLSPSAGVISRTATTSRQIQFGLKLIF